MTATSQNKVVFPQSLRDMFPVEAQKLYVESYEHSFASFKAGNVDLARESVASRDAWDAVRRQFVEDSVTHKWRRIGEEAQAPTRVQKRALLDILKGMLKRG